MSRRSEVAEILDALGTAQPFSFTLGGNDKALRLHRGADTLRWCDEFDPEEPDCDELAGQLQTAEYLTEELSDALDNLELLVKDWAQGKMAKPAAFRDQLIAAFAKRPDRS